MGWLDYEKDCIKNGYNIVCGIDEAGRGPLAGPVFAASVVLPVGIIIDGINDSKKLNEKKREKLFEIIKEKSLSYSVALATEKEIDEINILNATFLAMRRAVEGLNVKPDIILVDGNRDPSIGIPTKCIIKGDSKSQSIAAASILAKVSRDRLMKEFAREYPEYMFDKHKGYGTKLHRELLLKYGPCPIHRKTFLKKILGNV